jgi:putative transposase
MDDTSSSHSVQRLIYPIVLVGKFRRHVLTASPLKYLTYLTKLLPRIAAYYKYRTWEVNGEADPIHCLLECPPSTSVSTAVARLKSVSSQFFFNRYGSQFWSNHSRTLGNSGYFAASTGGVSIGILPRYVENQGRITSLSLTYPD